MKLFSALSNRSFTFLWTGQSISGFGIAIYSTCLPFLVFYVGGDAIELGLAHSYFIIPQIIFLLFGGVFVDRWSRKRVLIISDLIRGTAVFIVMILLWTNQLVIIHVYLLTGLMGLLSTFIRPAVRGIVPQLVNKEQLLSANSLRSISQQVSSMVGPVAGGALVATVGLYIAYGINSFTFLLSIVFVSLITIDSTRRKSNREQNKNSFWTDFKDGWNAIRKRGWLGAGILIGSLTNIGIASFDVLVLPVFAEEQFSGVKTYGWFLAAMAIGSLLCATMIGRIERIKHRGILYYTFMASSGIGVLLLSIHIHVVFTLFILMAIGFCLTAFVIIWESAIQELVEGDVLGRVTSFQMFGGLALLPIGYNIFGKIIDSFGHTFTMLLAGILIIGFSLLGLTNKKIRQLN